MPASQPATGESTAGTGPQRPGTPVFLLCSSLPPHPSRIGAIHRRCLLPACTGRLPPSLLWLFGPLASLPHQTYLRCAHGRLLFHGPPLLSLALREAEEAAWTPDSGLPFHRILALVCAALFVCQPAFFPPPQPLPSPSSSLSLRVSTSPPEQRSLSSPLLQAKGPSHTAPHHPPLESFLPPALKF